MECSSSVGLVMGLEGIRLQIHLEKLVKLEMQQDLESPSGMAFRLSKRCISEMWSRTVKSLCRQRNGGAAAVSVQCG